MPSRATRGEPDRRHAVGIERNLALLLVDRQVLDDQHRVIIADRRLRAAPWRRPALAGATTFRPGVPANQPSKRLRVLGGQLVAGAVRGADHQRAAHLAAEHRADLGRVVDDLVHRDEQEVDRHDLDDRPLAEHRRADAGADEALLGDRRVAHAVGAELVEQPGGHLVGAVEDADLLAHHEDAVVARHLLAHRQAQRLAVGHRLGARAAPGGRLGDAVRALTRRALRRRPARARRTGRPGSMRANCASRCRARTCRRRAVSTGGAGLASANSTAAATCSSTSTSSIASSSSSATPSLASSSAHAQDRVLAAVLVDLLRGAVGEPGVGDRVAAVAVGDRARAPPGGGPRGRRASSVEVACATASRSSPSTRSAGIVGGGAAVEVGHGRGAVDARAHPVLVVHDEEHDRQAARPRPG